MFFPESYCHPYSCNYGGFFYSITFIFSIQNLQIQVKRDQKHTFFTAVFVTTGPSFIFYLYNLFICHLNPRTIKTTFKNISIPLIVIKMQAVLNIFLFYFSPRWNVCFQKLLLNAAHASLFLLLRVCNTPPPLPKKDPNVE